VGHAREPFLLFLNYFDAHGPYEPPGGTPFRGDGLGRDDHQIPEYDGEIAFLDRHLGRLLAFLRERHLIERSLIVITADHGEYFGKKGLIGHAAALYEPVLHVPLVVRLPGPPRSGRVDRRTGLYEIPQLIREVTAGRLDLSLLRER